MNLPYTRTIGKSIALILLLIVIVLPAKAQNTVSNENLGQLLTILQKEQKANKIWWSSWLGIYSAATIVQTGIAVTTDNKPLKQDMYLGAATTLLGVGSQLITPVVKFDLDQFNSPNYLVEGNTDELMQNAKEYLKDAANYEKSIRSWKNHMMCSAVNLGSGLITWLAFDRTLKDGIVNFAINTAITEIQILTQPVIAQKALKNYTNLISAENYVPQSKKQFSLTASAVPNGLQFKIIF